MAELSYKWWIANKAKTLLIEPLSAALKVIAPLQEKMKSRNRAEDVETLLLKMPMVLKAIDGTLKLCLPVVHDTTKKNLRILKGLAAQLQSDLRELLMAYDTSIKEVNRLRAVLYKDAMVALPKPTDQSVGKIMDDCEAMGSAAEAAPLKHASFTSLTLLGGKGGGIYGHCKELRKLLVGGKPEKIESCKKALREQVVKLASLSVG